MKFVRKVRTDNRRPIDKTKRSNHRCRNCNHYYYNEECCTVCKVRKEEKQYYQTCKQYFEWNPDLLYLDQVHEEVEEPVVEDFADSASCDHVMTYTTANTLNKSQKDTSAVVKLAMLGVVALIATLTLKKIAFR